MPHTLLDIYDGRSDFWQWDTGQKLIVSDRIIDQIHFSNKSMTTAVVKEVYVDEDGIRVCDVPDMMLKMPYPLMAYAYVMDDDHNKTIYSVKFSVTKRPMPEDYTYEENNRFKDLVDKIESVEDILESGTSVKRFDSLIEAEAWAQDYKSPGVLLSVWNGTEWAIYMINEDYSLTQIGDLDQLLIDVAALQILVGDEPVADQIAHAILEQDLPNIYEKLGAAEAVRGELLEEVQRAKTEEAAITRAIQQIYGKLETLQAEIEAETERAKGAEAALDKRLKTVESAVGDNGHIPTLIEEALEEAKEHAEALNKNMDARVDAIESAIGDNGNIPALIEDAMEEAKEHADDLNKAMDARVKDIEQNGVKFDNAPFVSYKDKQTLTEAQKARARENIGAIDKSVLEDIGAVTTTPNEEIIELLIDLDMFPSVTDKDGAFLADENAKILLW